MPASPSEILRSWFERVWNAGDESAIDELYAANAVAHGLPAAPMPGPEGFKPFVRSFRSAFPNVRVEITHIVSEDRKSTRLNSSHSQISYAVFCLKKKKKKNTNQ